MENPFDFWPVHRNVATVGNLFTRTRLRRQAVYGGAIKPGDCTRRVKQVAQLSQRDRATPQVS